MRNLKLEACYYDMKYRCHSPKHIAYKHYGSRGITVCKTWKEDYKAFETWALTNGWSDNLSIDRRDNDKGYSPGNCRWVTKAVQSRNTRKIYRHNTSGFRGVTIRGKRFQTRIKVNGKQLSLGMYGTAEEAATAYDEYVIKNKLEHTLNLKKRR